MIEPQEVQRRLNYRQETGEFTWRVAPRTHPRLHGMPAGVLAPAGKGKSYHVIKLDGQRYKRSRLAYAWMTGKWPADQIDHINGDSTDDRWVNLRAVTRTQNAWNHKGRAKASGLPMGVRKMQGRYQARIAVNRKMIHLGCFDAPEKAAAAYQKAREVYYGEFA